MADTYKVNGVNVSKTEYDAFVAANPMPTLTPELMNASTLAKYNDISNLPPMTQAAQDFVANPNSTVDNTPFGERTVPGVPPGAQPKLSPPTEITVVDINGNKLGKDLRVKIRVPSDYLVDSTVGTNGELLQHGGIIFPYTPTISYDVKAEYSPTTPLHSNFAIQFYQRSSVGPITVTGKFSVQNAADAGVYLSTVNLLRALTKMRSGGETNSGSPPPVCRLDGHGDMGLNNVPVAITGFRVEYPDGVDYFTFPGYGPIGVTSVPVVSTIAVTCLPMYSRDEMLRFTVDGFLNDPSVRGQGYL
jgi:hypothetical protein